MLHRTWVLLRPALTILTVLALAIAPSSWATPSPATAAAPTKHPISGFFVAAGSTPAENAATMRQVQRVGGDTVITFGNTLQRSSLDSRGRIRTDGELDPTFTDCRLKGKPCAAAVRGKGRIRTVLTFANHSHFTQGALQCPQDRTFVSRGQRFTLLKIPTEGHGCSSPNGAYDLVAIHGGPTQGIDRTTSLLRAAQQAGVRVYIGMPSVEKRSDVPWLPDLSYRHTVAVFTERFLRYHKSVGQTAALAGFYHHTEMPVAAGEVWQPVLDLYTLQNRAIARVFPDKGALVSPYLDNRRTSNPGLSRADLLAKTRSGARAIAATSAGVPLTIAVQDGMGTGKAGAYLVNQADTPVDPYAAAFVGQGTWESIYLVSVSASFGAVAEGLQGTGATLWANLEGMTPEVSSAQGLCGSGFPRGPSTKQRLDQQVQAVGRYTAKNISFMWDPYYTCAVGGVSLAQALHRQAEEPLITNAAMNSSNDALWLAGYNLAGSTATVKYVDTHGRVHRTTAELSAFSSDYGKQAGLDPRLEGASYPVEFVAPQDGKIFIVSVTGRTGATCNHNFSLRY